MHRRGDRESARIAFGGRYRMNLAVWLPALFLLGLAALGLLFAFALGCKKV
jgi:hypothetical protein